MAYTGGGNPLPNQLRCGWCNYVTPKTRVHMIASAILERHAQEQHPQRYAAAMERAAQPGADGGAGGA